MIHLEPFDTPRATLERLLAAVAPGVAPGTRVFVKPNWCARTTPRRSENTTAAFLEALLGWLQERGAVVTVGHAALLTPPDVPYLGFSNLIRLAGCDRLLEQFPGVRFVDLEAEPMALVCGQHEQDGAIELLVPRLLLAQDLIVDCARLKTHMMTGVSVGTKNLMGMLPDSEKLRMHRDGLDRTLAWLGHLFPPALVLVEADVGMEGNGPHHGRDVEVGWYLGGDDLLDVDASACHLMGVDPASVTHLALLARLRGRELPALPAPLRSRVRAFEPAGAWLQHTPRVRVWPGDSCSTCHVAARTVEGWLHEHPDHPDLQAVTSLLHVGGFGLYLGHQPLERAPEQGTPALAIGDCALAWAERWGVPHIPGCPVLYHGLRPALVARLKGLRSLPEAG